MHANKYLPLIISLVLTIVVERLHAETGNEALAVRIALLVEQLGNDDYSEREAASDELAAIGEPALASLRIAARSADDLEVRWRARHISAAIGELARRNELDRWQGRWEGPAGEWFTFRGNRWSSGTPTFGPVGGTATVVEIQEKLVLVDLLVQEGPTAGKLCRAIFRLDGDTLHYCGTYEARRPTEFKTEGIYYACSLNRAKNAAGPAAESGK